jgi:cell division protein FtsB
VFIAGVTTVILVVMSDLNETEQQENLQLKLGSIQTQNDSLIANNDSLIGQFAGLSNKFDSVAHLYEPIAEIARRQYPGDDISEAMVKMAADVGQMRQDVQKLQRKLVFLESRTTKVQDSLWHAYYHFRSSSPEGAQDVAVRMRFENPIVGFAHSFAASAVVLDNTTFREIDSNGKGLTYRNSFIPGANELIIEVFSRVSVQIARCEMSP